MHCNAMFTYTVDWYEAVAEGKRELQKIMHAMRSVEQQNDDEDGNSDEKNQLNMHKTKKKTRIEFL